MYCFCMYKEKWANAENPPIITILLSSYFFNPLSLITMTRSSAIGTIILPDGNDIPSTLKLPLNDILN